MKILDLCEFYSERGGGVRSYLSKMFPAAAARGHELVIVAPGAADAVEEVPGGRTVRYASPRMPYDPTYFAPIRVDRMRALVHEERPDVLQISSPFLPAAVARTLRGVPVKVYVYHSDPIGCYLRPLAQRLLDPARAERALEPAWAWMRAICRSCDATVVAGAWLKEELENHGCDRVRTVPFGITHADFGPDRFDASVRKELLGPIADQPAARLVLVAGRLAADKRQMLLVKALKALSTRRPIALVVLGDGPERERLMEAAKELSHSTFLRFTRDRAHYASVLSSVDALVHGSRCETYGFVIVETLASGTPVVAPAAGAAGALVDPSCGATYGPQAGPEEIAEVLEQLLNRSAKDLQAAACRVAAAQPSIDTHFDGLFSLYAELLGDAVGSPL